MDHDQIHKTLIELFFREFMELFCPDEAAEIDFEHVEFLKQEYFTDLLTGEKKVLDLVAKVRLLGGGEKYVLVHIEFEASRKDEDFPERMFQYFCQLFSRQATTIVPIAVFTDDVRWRTFIPNFYEIKLSGKRYVRFDYHLIKLKNHDYRRFLKSNNPLAYALMAKMNYNRRERLRLKADFLRLIVGAGVDPARESVLLGYVEAYMPLAPPEQQAFNKLITTKPEYEKVKEMVTLEQIVEQRGIEKGIEQGVKQGVKQGEIVAKQKTLVMQLERKFGKLTAAIRRRIHKIESNKELDALLLKVLEIESLEELPL